MPVLGFRRGPPHATIAEHELRLKLGKHAYKTRAKERKMRESFEKQELKARMKHAENLARLQAEEKAKLKHIMKRARA